MNKIFQELEKAANRYMKLSAKETMRIAEKLYSQGYVSYPRTETNIFPTNMDLASLVEAHTGDGRWGRKYILDTLLCLPHIVHLRYWP